MPPVSCNIIEVGAAGIAATLLMTGSARLIAPAVRVVRRLGTMLTNSTTPEKGLSPSPRVMFTGVPVHYAIGVLFSLVYHWLWSKEIGRPDLLNCLLLGGISGIIAVLVWKSYLTFHRNPPLAPRFFLPVIFIGHIVFGAGIFFTKLII